MRTGNGKIIKSEPKATGLRFVRDRLIVHLDDQREVSVPLSHYPTLQKATSSQRNQWELIGDGLGFSWEALDLHLLALGLANGWPEAIPAPPALKTRPRLRKAVPR